MTLDYLIYDLETGRIKHRLTANIGVDRRANVREDEGAILAGDVQGTPVNMMVDLATKTLVPIPEAAS